MEALANAWARRTVQCARVEPDRLVRPTRAHDTSLRAAAAGAVGGTRSGVLVQSRAGRSTARDAALSPAHILRELPDGDLDPRGVRRRQMDRQPADRIPVGP